jgi:hypothetical protein
MRVPTGLLTFVHTNHCLPYLESLAGIFAPHGIRVRFAVSEFPHNYLLSFQPKGPRQLIRQLMPAPPALNAEQLLQELLATYPNKDWPHEVLDLVEIFESDLSPLLWERLKASVPDLMVVTN